MIKIFPERIFIKWNNQGTGGAYILLYPHDQWKAGGKISQKTQKLNWYQDDVRWGQGQIRYKKRGTISAHGSIQDSGAVNQGTYAKSWNIIKKIQFQGIGIKIAL